MSEASWGKKRQCPSCLIWFYDFSKDPIVCPGCEERFEAKSFLQLNRGRTQQTVEPDKPEVGGETFRDDIESIDDADDTIIESTEDLADDDIPVKKPKIVDEDQDDQ